MDTVISLLDAVGFFLVISALFLPAIWFVGYFIWQSINWKATEAIRYSFEELKGPQTLPVEAPAMLPTEAPSLEERKKAA